MSLQGALLLGLLSLSSDRLSFFRVSRSEEEMFGVRVVNDLIAALHIMECGVYRGPILLVCHSHNLFDLFGCVSFRLLPKNIQDFSPALTPRRSGTTRWTAGFVFWSLLFGSWQFTRHC